MRSIVRAGTDSGDEFACTYEFAQLNLQFGIHFPMGRRDRPRMEASGPSSSNLRVAALGVVEPRITPCTKKRLMLKDEPLD